MQGIAQPGQPAGDKMVAQGRAQFGAGQQDAPVPAQNLHRALRPAPALALIGGKVGRNEAGAEHLIDINDAQILLQEAQAEFGVFTDAGRLPAAHLAQGRGADQGHRAMLDRRVALLTVVHADAEKAVVLPIHHAAQR